MCMKLCRACVNEDGKILKKCKECKECAELYEMCEIVY